MATITGTIQVNGNGIQALIRAWFVDGPTVGASGAVNSEAAILTATAANGTFSLSLVEGRWILTWDAGGVMNRKEIDVPAGSDTYTLDLVAVEGGGGGGGGGTTFDVYWGTSSLATLDASQIQSLANTAAISTVQRTWDFGAAEGQYKYFAWPDSAGSPRVDDGFKLGVFAVPLAGADEGFEQTQNGWSYLLVTISGVTYRLYRTLYQLGGAVQIVVTK